MKKKIISLLLCTTLVVGACGKYSHAHEERVTPKSAVAISGATATAILTLATYAGFQFKDSNSFDEFLRRMCGMEQSVDFLVSVTSLVGKSIDGTIDFTKELIDDFKFMANRIALSKDVVYKTDSSGNSFAVIDYNTLNTNSKNIFPNNRSIGYTILNRSSSSVSTTRKTRTTTYCTSTTSLPAIVLNI